MIAAKRISVWNEADQEWDERAASVEEYIEMRRHSKRLEDCVLPAEFRLLHASPKQYWVNSQLRWGFCLAWARVDGKGRRGVEEYFHFARYEQGLSDEVQMRWAMEDFIRDLEMAEKVVQVPVHRPKVQVLFVMKVA